ncbi:GNAT family N-acetyltransferase [Candidatus Woesearchaeota archaeon]|nr:GNAT family N-acetyltransferase [Candidatus Woesearchaeota archaeon]
MTIRLRPQEMEDAERFFEILDNKNFIFFEVMLESVEDERAWLEKSFERKKNNQEHNYTILLDEKIIGGCGIKIRQHRQFIGEIGYFIDEEHWRKGIATEATKRLEKIGFEELGLNRIEVWMHPDNKGSEKVAVKSGYKKEGFMRKCVFNKRKQGYQDALLYAKTKKDYLASQATSSVSKS